MTPNGEFAQVVTRDLVEPLVCLCALFETEQAHQEFAFFSSLLLRLREPADEAEVLLVVIELSKCAFLGFDNSVQARLQIDALLGNAITLSHTMSAGNEPN